MRSMQILVVDDDRDSAEGLAEVLDFSGHDVTLAFDGPAAVEMVHRQHFDVAFMDIMMPSMNGIESLIEFQKIRPGIKVLMMTGYSLEELIAKATDNGALPELGVMVKLATGSRLGCGPVVVTTIVAVAVSPLSSVTVSVTV